MRRHEWEFKYTGAALAAAARAQADYRAGRLTFWKGEKEKIMQLVKEKGLSVHEDMIDRIGVSNAKYGSAVQRGAQIMVDRTMQEDLNRAMERIQHHEQLEKEYRAWEQVMAAHPEQQVDLNHDDWIYFFGK